MPGEQEEGPVSTSPSMTSARTPFSAKLASRSRSRSRSSTPRRGSQSSEAGQSMAAPSVAVDADRSGERLLGIGGGDDLAERGDVSVERASAGRGQASPHMPAVVPRGSVDVNVAGLLQG